MMPFLIQAVGGIALVAFMLYLPQVYRASVAKVVKRDMSYFLSLGYLIMAGIAGAFVQGVLGALITFLLSMVPESGVVAILMLLFNIITIILGVYVTYMLAANLAYKRKTTFKETWAVMHTYFFWNVGFGILSVIYFASLPFLMLMSAY